MHTSMRFLSGLVVATMCALILTVGAAPFLVQVLAQEKAMQKEKRMMKEKSLYERLGGKKAITAVVDEFVVNVGADTKINHFFAHTDLKHLKKMLVDQICEATGGPCKYKGKDMKTAHKGMGVTEDDFNALVGDLVKALDKFKVGEKEKGQLLAALGGMKDDIVEKK